MRKPDSSFVDNVVVSVAKQQHARVVPSGGRLFAYLLAVRHSNADAQVCCVGTVDAALEADEKEAPCLLVRPDSCLTWSIQSSYLGSRATFSFTRLPNGGCLLTISSRSRGFMSSTLRKVTTPAFTRAFDSVLPENEE